MKFLASDLRFALRGLRRNPVFSTVAILSLALGIGANTAIFTLDRPGRPAEAAGQEPRRAGDALPGGRRTTAATWARGCTRIPSTRTTSSAPRRLSEVLCRRLVPASVSIDNHTERLEAEMVSGNFFTMLGVRPAAGRVFNSRDDDQVVQGPPGRRARVRLLGRAASRGTRLSSARRFSSTTTR